MISRISRFFRHKFPTSHPANIESFSHFLFKNTVNKKYLLLALAGILVQFFLYKLCYPFANYFTDSYTYIYAAKHHQVISVRPIGYSRFLEGIHVLTTSETIVIFIQYLAIQIGGLLLFFSVRYFFPLQKSISNWLFAILVFNPVVLYTSNSVSSDPLFIGLCLLWFTQLLWIINRPQWIQLVSMAGLLFLAFTFRYAALYLPAIAVLALLFSRRTWIFKLTGMALTILPIIIETQRIRHVTKKETGTEVFSAFAGWMSANNALYMYPHIEVKDADLPSSELVNLNHIVKQYFDTLPASARPYPIIGDKYLWRPNSPLKGYMHLVQKQKKIKNYFNGWNAVAPAFLQYGNRLVMQHPVAFAHYFMWPNVKYYCFPLLESMVCYNEMRDTVDTIAARWFNNKSTQVTCVSKTIQTTILRPLPYWFLLVNVVFCILLTLVIIRAKRYSLPPALLHSLLLTGGLWILNFCFSLYAAVIQFRYQIFPMILYSAFSLLLINIMIAKPIKQQSA